MPLSFSEVLDPLHLTVLCTHARTHTHAHTPHGRYVPSRSLWQGLAHTISTGRPLMTVTSRSARSCTGFGKCGKPQRESSSGRRRAQGSLFPSAFPTKCSLTPFIADNSQSRRVATPAWSLGLSRDTFLSLSGCLTPCFSFCSGLSRMFVLKTSWEEGDSVALQGKGWEKDTGKVVLLLLLCVCLFVYKILTIIYF